MKTSLRFLAALAGWAALVGGATACSIKVYRVDQQTVLEDEAAGEWPEFEKEILAQAQSGVPTPFPTSAASARKARLFSVLNHVGGQNGEEKSSAPAQAKPGRGAESPR